MASVKFLIRGVKNPSPLYVRFVHTKEIDITHRINILINPKNWDAKKELIKNVLEVKNRNELNHKLAELKLSVIDSFNNSYIQGEIIDKEWLSNCLNKFFYRPVDEIKFKINKNTIFFYDFMKWWIEEKAPSHKTSATKLLSNSDVKNYIAIAELFNEFQGKNKIKLCDLTNEVFDGFSNFLTTKNYATSTKKRHISRIKFFCNRAEELNLNINKGYKERIFIEDKQELIYKAPYLSIQEINIIYSLELTDKRLDNSRDNFIIGLWTGLRVSDFLKRLSLSNIDNAYIKTITKKTNTHVAIPIHPQIKEILKKRNGILPKKSNNERFNEDLKEICRLAGFDKKMIGGIQIIKEDPITGKKIKRKIVGEFKKYELVSSHICRRSFATNHFGKVPNKVIMDVCGWASEHQMLEYNKQTNIESANLLADYWDREMKKLEETV